jgi:hypothetical protein
VRALPVSSPSPVTPCSASSGVIPERWRRRESGSAELCLSAKASALTTEFESFATNCVRSFGEAVAFTP